MVVRVPINREVLEWAINRTGKDTAELAATSDLSRIEDWLSGRSQPTIRQAETLAKKASLPYPMLLLEKPAPRAISLPDFRTVASNTIENPSVELEQVIDRAQLQLEWYVDFARESGVPPVELLGIASIDQDPEQVANSLRPRLSWTPGSISLGDRAVSFLAESIEESGVLVARNSVVGNSTRKPLDVQEFRGFTLIREGYALIFVNTRDSKGAQLFSLGHELAHVLIAEPGVSAETVDFRRGERLHGQIEAWCNKFSASFLMPADYLLSAFKKGSIAQDELEMTAQRLGVSLQALCYRLANLELLDQNQLPELLVKQAPIRPRSSGGDSYRNMQARVGKRLLTAIRDSLGTDLITTREALNLVGASQRKTLDGLFGVLEGAV